MAQRALRTWDKPEQKHGLQNSRTGGEDVVLQSRGVDTGRQMNLRAVCYREVFVALQIRLSNQTR